MFVVVPRRIDKEVRYVPGMYYWYAKVNFGSRSGGIESMIRRNRIHDESLVRKW
jgi:hypothetical protein